MSKYLIVIAVASSGLALMVSMTAKAATAQPEKIAALVFKSIGTTAVSDENRAAADESKQNPERFPLILPQPTIDKSAKYQIGQAN